MYYSKTKTAILKRQVACMVAVGRSISEIAEKLGITRMTAYKYAKQPPLNLSRDEAEDSVKGIDSTYEMLQDVKQKTVPSTSAAETITADRLINMLQNIVDYGSIPEELEQTRQNLKALWTEYATVKGAEKERIADEIRLLWEKEYDLKSWLKLLKREKK